MTPDEIVNYLLEHPHSIMEITGGELVDLLEEKGDGLVVREFYRAFIYTINPEGKYFLNLEQVPDPDDLGPDNIEVNYGGPDSSKSSLDYLMGLGTVLLIGCMIYGLIVVFYTFLLS